CPAWQAERLAGHAIRLQARLDGALELAQFAGDRLAEAHWQLGRLIVGNWRRLAGAGDLLEPASDADNAVSLRLRARAFGRVLARCARLVDACSRKRDRSLQLLARLRRLLADNAAADASGEVEVDWLQLAAMPKFYCDYCDTFLTHDSRSVRKTHCSGRHHRDAVRMYYQKWLEEQVQKLVDNTTAAFKSGAARPGRGPPMSMPPPPPTSAGFHQAPPSLPPPPMPLGSRGGPPAGAMIPPPVSLGHHQQPPHHHPYGAGPPPGFRGGPPPPPSGVAGGGLGGIGGHRMPPMLGPPRGFPPRHGPMGGGLPPHGMR
uniref:U1 small nuclear ribonucleoprotein C n=2 Tax=Macrostomum lignano TaxID=282301 RepID=A0A1I8IEV0_9PLAT